MRKIIDLYNRLLEYTIVKKLAFAIDFFINKNVLTAASALTYSTLLAIVPICAVVFSIARGFGYTIYIEEWFTNLLSTQPQAAEAIIGFVNSYLEHTKSGIILGIGLLFMLYTVGNLSRNVEQTFNDIWHVENRKNMVRTFTDYITIFFLVPFVIILMSGISLFITTLVSQSDWKDYLGPVMQLIIDISPIVLMWLIFAALYVFMPNTKVKFCNGLGPALVATIGMQILQFFYVHAQMFVSNYNAIYGSFAALPLFMLWIQFSWSICLFGAELCYTNQNLEDFTYSEGASMLSHRNRLTLSVIIMNKICRRFADGQTPYTAVELKQELGMPLTVTRDLINKLVRTRLLTEVVDLDGRRDIAYQPAISLEHLTVGHLLDSLEADGSQEFPVDLQTPLRDSKTFREVQALRQQYVHKLDAYQLDKL